MPGYNIEHTLTESSNGGICSTQNWVLITNYEKIYKFRSLKNLNQSVGALNVKK